MGSPKILLFILSILATRTLSLELKSGAYEDLVITISDEVPTARCKDILLNLESVLSSASNYLFSALHGRAFIRSSTVILPSSWPNSCSPNKVVSASGEKSDITILPGDASKGKMWTQQSGGCGRPGDQIYLGYKALEQKDATLGHSLVKEFAMYRYGVFEEQGYKNDPVHPMCYYDKDNKVKVTGCSDFPINDNGICDGTSTEYNVTKMVDAKARTSIMFAPEAPSVSMFCDDGNHDSYAPTKHNLICNRRNTFDVILQHSDFHSYSPPDNSRTIANTSAKITYKRHISTRYVFVIENTKNMADRESWSFLRSAIRKWVQFDLPDNSEVGLVLTNDTDAFIASGIKNLKNEDKNIISSALPYYTAETSQSPCLHCAISKALDMFKETSAPATNVVIVISAGVNNSTQMHEVLKRAKEEKVRIATVTYPRQRQRSLDYLAEMTDGVAYSVNEQKQNVDHSMISTYFQLCNALYNIIEVFYAGNLNDIPLEIHRREIKSDRSSITGSFYLDDNMSGPIKFMLYTHNQNPLIRNIELVSPTQQVFRQRIDTLDVKIVSIRPNITETGTWTYTIEPVTGNPQPHFLQVTATPRNRASSIVRSKFWISKNMASPPILYVEVKKGNNPIISAKVEVRITKTEANGSIWHQETIQLFDTGAGDPDITKGDGIYTRYHNAFKSGPGTYTYEVVVNDNGSTAYVYEVHPYGTHGKSRKAMTMAPFERFLSPITLELTQEDINTANQQLVGRILDLRVEIRQDELKASLSWTSPDMGGHEVAFYEVKFAETIEDVADHFEIKAKPWDIGTPHPLSVGSDTTFRLDFSQRKELLDRTFYFAVKATAKISSVSTISNFVRVFVKSPPPPPTAPPTYSTNDHSSYPFDDYNTINSVRPNKVNEGGFGNEIIFAVVGIVILLIVILAIYYCFCVRRKNRAMKSKEDTLKNPDKMNTTITIVPNTPINQPAQQNCYSNQISDNDHTIGVPISYPYDDEPKKRYSLVQQQEQQLIEELKQQHMQNPQNYSGLSVISNGSLQRNQPTLSPFNSWSASQLLHEHERRQSPADEQMLTQHQEVMNQLDHMSLNGQNVDHVSLSSHQMGNNVDHYGTGGHVPPPVPPLPVFNGNYPPVNYIYGVHQPQNQIYQTMPRGEQYSTSLQGSMNSVNSGEKKRRNVTMV